MRHRLQNLSLLFLAAVLLLSPISPVRAQMFGTHHERRTAVTSVDAVVSPSSAKAGSRATLMVTVHLAEGFHINANKPNSPQWIPTILTVNSTRSVRFGSPIYPVVKSVTESYFKQPLLVYTGVPVIRVPVMVGHAKPGFYTITGSLSYQGCNDKTCLPPGTLPISATITVK